MFRSYFLIIIVHPLCNPASTLSFLFAIQLLPFLWYSDLVENLYYMRLWSTDTQVSCRVRCSTLVRVTVQHRPNTRATFYILDITDVYVFVSVLHRLEDATAAGSPSVLPKATKEALLRIPSVILNLILEKKKPFYLSDVLLFPESLFFSFPSTRCLLRCSIHGNQALLRQELTVANDFGESS